MLGQIAQDGQGPRTQGDELVATPQAAMRQIQPERLKDEVVLLHHGTSCRRLLERRSTIFEHRQATSAQKLNVRTLVLNSDRD
jgi:hypothetical protein